MRETASPRHTTEGQGGKAQAPSVFPDSTRGTDSPPTSSRTRSNRIAHPYTGDRTGEMQRPPVRAHLLTEQVLPVSDHSRTSPGPRTVPLSRSDTPGERSPIATAPAPGGNARTDRAHDDAGSVVVGIERDRTDPRGERRPASPDHVTPAQRRDASVTPTTSGKPGAERPLTANAGGNVQDAPRRPLRDGWRVGGSNPPPITKRTAPGPMFEAMERSPAEGIAWRDEHPEAERASTPQPAPASSSEASRRGVEGARLAMLRGRAWAGRL
jgi:hypothetical protein